jgi:hypothetical protein
VSTNCVACVVNRRTGFDLLCDECRELEPARNLRQSAKSADETPYGFRVTIERTGRDSFSPERHTFPSKTPRRTYAVQAAGYKKGFLRLVEAVPLTREEFDREFGQPHTKGGA